MKRSVPLLFAAIITMAFVSCNDGGTSTETSGEETNAVKSEEGVNQKGEIHWKGSMVGMYDHRGTIQMMDVVFEVADGKVVSGSFMADMNSIHPTDENYNEAEGKTPAKLVEHLQSADFFDVANFPTAKFVITESSDEGYVTGEMTIKGVTHLEKAKVGMSEDGKTLEGTLVFDRTKYGVSFTHPMKEMVLDNNIELAINLKQR